MMLSEVISLTHGSIIELPKAIDEPLDILINNTPIGHGHAVKVSENFGVHVHDVTPMRDRVRAMGPVSQPSAEDAQAPAAAAG